MLQTFLRNNLITLSDDSQLDKLKKSSQELIKRIKKDKKRIYSFTLAAIDPNIPADNNEIKEVVGIFEKTWPTYTSVTHDTPIPFARAVILHSLLELSADLTVAGLIYMSARNVIKHLNFSPLEEKTILTFLTEITLKIGNAADEKFQIRHMINNSMGVIEGVKKTFVDETSISKTLSGDFGDGTVSLFIPKVVKSYSTIVNNAYSALIANMQTVSASVNALGLKTELIWWKTSAYSPMFKKPYKEMATPVLEFAIAADYASFMPFIFPESVNYFLKTAYVEMTEMDETITLSAFFEGMNNNREELNLLSQDLPIAEGRISLINFTSGILFNKLNITDLQRKVGIAPTLSLKKSELTVWLFHDILCHNTLN